MPQIKRTFAENLEKIASFKPDDLPEHKLLYLPILKGKAGELGALQELNISVKSKILPLIEVPAVTWDYVKEAPAKTTSNHVKAFHKKLIECWGVDYPLIIDTFLLEDDEMDGMLAIDYLLGELHSQGVEAIPVVRLNEKKPYLDVIKKHLKNVKKVCLRITYDDVTEFDTSLDVPHLLGLLSLDESEVDLVLDFKDVTDKTASIFLAFAKMTIGTFPNLSKYNTFSLAMTSFPDNLSEYDGGSVSAITRTEWKLWKDLVGGKIKRAPVFGDYGISSSSISDVDPRIMQMSASIRYSRDDRWMIVKGRSVKKHLFDQFYELADTIVKSRFYYGEDYSWGDKIISAKAKGSGGTGSATTWRQVGTNHHLTVVVSQLLSM